MIWGLCKGSLEIIIIQPITIMLKIGVTQLGPDFSPKISKEHPNIITPTCSCGEQLQLLQNRKLGFLVGKGENRLFVEIDPNTILVLSTIFT